MVGGSLEYDIAKYFNIIFLPILKISFMVFTYFEKLSG